MHNLQVVLVNAQPLVQLLHLTAASSQYDGQRQSLRAAIRWQQHHLPWGHTANCAVVDSHSDTATVPAGYAFLLAAVSMLGLICVSLMPT
jgi:hypothetical protein